MQSCIILFQSSPVTMRKSIATPVTGDSKLARLDSKEITFDQAETGQDEEIYSERKI